LDFIGSWEWTIPGGASEIQRTIIGSAVSACPVNRWARDDREFVELHPSCARWPATCCRPVRRMVAAHPAGWPGLEIAEHLGGSEVSSPKTAVVTEELRPRRRPQQSPRVAVGIGALLGSRR
jgi:hypothetical protein